MQNLPNTFQHKQAMSAFGHICRHKFCHQKKGVFAFIQLETVGIYVAYVCKKVKDSIS